MSLTTKLQGFLQKIPWLRFWIILAIGFALLFAFTKYAMIIFFLILNIVTALAYKFLHNRSIGVEFITLSTFVCWYNYGFWTAFFFLEILVFIFMMITMTITPNMLICFPLSAILLLLMLPFKSLGILTTGMMFTISLNVILTIIVILFGTGKLHRRLIFFVTHVLSNWFILKNIAPSLIAD